MDTWGYQCTRMRHEIEAFSFLFKAFSVYGYMRISMHTYEVWKWTFYVAFKVFFICVHGYVHVHIWVWCSIIHIYIYIHRSGHVCIYHQISSYPIIYEHISSYLIISHHVWLHHHISAYITIYHFHSLKSKESKKNKAIFWKRHSRSLKSKKNKKNKDIYNYDGRTIQDAAASWIVLPS